MKKGFALILASATAASLAVPAAAQDNSPFTGFRVEGVGGFDISQAGSSEDNDINENDDQSAEGFVYGVGVGYDVAVGGVVLGLEGELTDSTADAEFNEDGDFGNFGLGRVSAGRDIYVGARAGILVTPSTLAYVKGGYTNARFDTLARDGETETSRDIDTDGFRLGAGVEQSISQNAFVKVEYRYSNYSDAEVNFEEFSDPVREFSIDVDRHQVMAGVGLRF